MHRGSSFAGIRRGAPWAAAIAGALVLALLLAPTGAAAPVGSGATPATAAAGPGSPSAWAYGDRANFSVDVTTNQTTFAVHGWFAYHVILSQTNTSATTLELEANRTFGFAYDAQGTFCLKACLLSPTVHALISVRATEHDVGFANFTTLGNVTSDGSAVPALALTNDSTVMSARYNESTNYSATLNGHTYSARNQVQVGVRSSAAVAFSPALGLIPNSVAPGMNWTSTSTYSAAVSTTGSIVSSRTAWDGGTSSSGLSINPSVNRTGTVALFGVDLQNLTLQDGATVPAIVLVLGGPFDAREGMMFLPAAGDPLSRDGAAYEGESSGSVRAGTQVVDWAGLRSGHLGLLASASGITPAPAPDSAITSTSPTETATGSTGSAPPMVRPNASAVPPAPAAEFQAQPEPVSAAVQGDVCIVAGNCGSTTVPGGSSPLGHPFLGAILFVSAVVVLAGLLAALIATRRNIPKPPASSTPAYPPAPGGTLIPPPSPGTPGRPTGPTPPADAESDPLGHLG